MEWGIYSVFQYLVNFVLVIPRVKENYFMLNLCYFYSHTLFNHRHSLRNLLLGDFVIVLTPGSALTYTNLGAAARCAPRQCGVEPIAAVLQICTACHY